MTLKKAEKSKPKVLNQSDSLSWHQKIAKNRSLSWRKNLSKGKLRVLLNPSEMRIARLTKGLQQEAVAKKLAMSESTFGAIERGLRRVDKVNADKISKLFGLDAKKLFKADGKKFLAAINK